MPNTINFDDIQDLGSSSGNEVDFDSIPEQKPVKVVQPKVPTRQAAKPVDPYSLQAVMLKHPGISAKQAEAVLQDLIQTKMANVGRSEAGTALNAAVGVAESVPGFWARNVVAPVIGGVEAGVRSIAHLTTDYHEGKDVLGDIGKEWTGMGRPGTVAGAFKQYFEEGKQRIHETDVKGPSRYLATETGEKFENPEWQTFNPQKGNKVVRAIKRTGNELLNREVGNTLIALPAEAAKFAAGGQLAVGTAIADAGTSAWEYARQQISDKHPDKPLTFKEEATAAAEGIANAAMSYLLMKKVPGLPASNTKTAAVTKEAIKQTALATLMTGGENTVALLHDPQRNLFDNFWKNFVTFQGFGIMGLGGRLAKVKGKNVLSSETAAEEAAPANGEALSDVDELVARNLEKFKAAKAQASPFREATPEEAARLGKYGEIPEQAINQLDLMGKQIAATPTEPTIEATPYSEGELYAKTVLDEAARTRQEANNYQSEKVHPSSKIDRRQSLYSGMESGYDLEALLERADIVEAQLRQELPRANRTKESVRNLKVIEGLTRELDSINTDIRLALGTEEVGYSGSARAKSLGGLLVKAKAEYAKTKSKKLLAIVDRLAGELASVKPDGGGEAQADITPKPIADVIPAKSEVAPGRTEALQSAQPPTEIVPPVLEQIPSTDIRVEMIEAALKEPDRMVPFKEQQEPGEAPGAQEALNRSQSMAEDAEAQKMMVPIKGESVNGYKFKTSEQASNQIEVTGPNGERMVLNLQPQQGVAAIDQIMVPEGERGMGLAPKLMAEATKVIGNAYPEVKWIVGDVSSAEAAKMMDKYPSTKAEGNARITSISDLMTGEPTGAPEKPLAGNEYIEYLNSGLNVQHAAADILGMKRGATWSEMAPVAMEKIGRLGATVKETAIRIMNKIQGISRELADKMAQHLHDVFGGTEKGQMGAVGADVKTRSARLAEMKEKFPERYEQEVARQKEQREVIEWTAQQEGWSKEEKAKWMSRIRPISFEEPVAQPETTKRAAVEMPKVVRFVQDMFGANVGETGEATKENVRELNARGRGENAKRYEEFRRVRSKVDKLDRPAKEALTDAIESPEGVSEDSPYGESVKALRTEYDNLWNRMKAAGIDGVGYVENYLSLMAKDPQKANEIMGPKAKTLAGPAGFLKARKLANHAEMRALGIEPKYLNPFDTALVSMAGMERLINAKLILNEEVASGRVVEGSGQKAPEGMVELDRNITSKIGSKDADGNALHYYADPGVATVFNNHVSKGMLAMKGASAYKVARTLADSSTSLQLAISGFHFTFAIADAQFSTLALGLAEAERGNYGKAALNVAKAITPLWAPIDLFRDGRTLRKAYLEGKVPEKLKPLANAVLMAGGTFSNADFKIDPLHRNFTDAFRNAAESYKTGAKGEAAKEVAIGVAKMVPAILETVNKPLMEHMIPSMKLGVFSQLAAFEMSKGPENLRPRLQRAWQVTEDRLGQMTYDNLFWDKAAQQALHIATRSVGWNLGTFNVAKGATDIFKTGLKPSNISHRTNYVVATIVGTAINGMILQYLSGNGLPKARKNPKDEFLPYVPGSSDAFTPVTGRPGETDQHGNPIRTMPAGYMKDLAEFARMSAGKASIVDFLASKANPMISGVSEALANKDSMGNEIGNVGERIAHTIPHPIAFEQVSKAREEGASWPRALAPAVGFPAAKKDLVSTAAENALREALKKRGASQDADAAEERMKLSRYAEAWRKGRTDIAKEALAKGEISPGQMRWIQNKSKITDFMETGSKSRNLTFEDLYDVYQKGNPEERRTIRAELMNRYAREYPNASPSRQEEMLEIRRKLYK